MGERCGRGEGALNDPVEMKRIDKGIKSREHQSYMMVLGEISGLTDRDEKVDRWNRWLEKRFGSGPNVNHGLIAMFSPQNAYAHKVNIYLDYAIRQNRDELRIPASQVPSASDVIGGIQAGVLDSIDACPDVVPKKGTIRRWSMDEKEFIRSRVDAGINWKKAYVEYIAHTISTGFLSALKDADVDKGLRPVRVRIGRTEGSFRRQYQRVRGIK